MASPTVNGTPSLNNVQTAATSFVLTMPGSIAAGELLVAVVAHKATDATGAIGGWTRFLDAANAAGSVSVLSVFWKAAAGGDTGTFTATSTRIAYAVYRIGGAEIPGIQPPEATSTTTNNTAAPNPPAITPTGGSKDYLVLATFASSHGRITNAGAANAGIPTNYTSSQTSGPDNGTATNIGIGVAQRALTASSEDPGAFTTTGTGVEEIAAATIAIHPAAASRFMSVITMTGGA